jgi:DNA ligase-associated metallophosphoesterase
LIIQLQGEDFLLTPEKALVQLNTKTAFMADLHLGKSAHFRKSGIPVPSNIIHDELDRLEAIILKYELQKVFFLGDLFHSDLNNEWQLFEDFLLKYNDIQFTLVRGNHDILPDELYNKKLIELVDEPFNYGAFTLSHHPLAKEELVAIAPQFNLSGHIHPGISVKGKGKTSLKLPCYFKTERQMILPAFGRFTGLVIQKGDSSLTKHYAITTQKVMLLKPTK